MPDTDTIFGLVQQECDRLAALGSADAIADELRRRKIKGARRMGCECPLSIAIGKEIGFCVEVQQWDIRWFDCWVNAYNRLPLITKYEPIRRFISRFDAGDYPDLEA